MEWRGNTTSLVLVDESAHSVFLLGIQHTTD